MNKDEKLPKNMPIVEWVMDENNQLQGIDCVSRVEKGAMKNPFVLLSDVEQEVKLSGDNYKQWITGALAIPMRGIVRLGKRDNGQEFFYLAFINRDNIEKAYVKFFVDGNNNNTNLHHIDQTLTQQDILIESWIKMSENDKSVDLFPKENYPLGTVFFTYYVPDKTRFEKILTGEEKTNCFSLEAVFGMRLITDPNEKAVIQSQLLSEVELNEIKTNLNKTKNTMKNKLKEKFANTKLTDLMTASGDVLVVDDVTYVATINGYVPYESEIILADGSVAVIHDGVLVALVPAPIQNLSKIETPKDEADKTAETKLDDQSKDVATDKKDEASTPTAEADKKDEEENKGEANLGDITNPMVTELSAVELATQLAEVKSQLSVLSAELTATKTLNDELTAKNEKLSKLPTAERLSASMSPSANDSTAPIMDEAKLTSLPLWQQYAYLAEQALNNK